MNSATHQLIRLMERGWIPDATIRYGIRQVLKNRLSSLPLHNPEATESYLADFIDKLARAPVAVLPEKANEHPRIIKIRFGIKILQTIRFRKIYSRWIRNKLVSD